MNKHQPMRLVCPGCGVYGTIETFASDADARAVAGLLGELQPDVAAAVQRYLRLFAPAVHALTWHKARKVLAELVPLIKSGEIQRNGRPWPAPGAAWISAIESMVGNQNLELPMKSHGYLLSILAGEANKAEAKAEAQTESTRRTGAAGRAASRGPATLAGVLGAALADHDEQAQQSQIRTATAVLMNEQARLQKLLLRTDLTDEGARQLLSGTFGAAVVEAAIANLHRLRALA